MPEILKRVISLITGVMVAFWALGPGVAYGITAEELQEQINALLEQLAQLQAQLAALEGEQEEEEEILWEEIPAPCLGISFERNLKIGMSGDDVKCLQALLNTDPETQLAESGPGSPGNETNYFGPLTKGAVIKFQEKYAEDVLAPWGLTKGTGFVGPTTRAKLNELLTALGEEEEEEEEEWIGEEEEEEEVIEEEVEAGLMVEIAEDNPPSATIVADSDYNPTSPQDPANGAQALIPFLKLVFTNGDEEEVKVTQINFKRSGISADADISQAYLYEGDELLAEYTSFSNGVLTFSSTEGLFAIAPGESKTITLKADLANGTVSGKTIRFSVESKDDISSDASAVNGDFPLTGNYMSTAQASDLGRLDVDLASSPPASVDPQPDFEVFAFNLQALDQKIEVRKITLTNIGSTDVDDLKNFKLYDGGTQIGGPLEKMAPDKTVTFDLSNNPLVIERGVVKNLHVRADIVGGTNRTFRFSIQNLTDILAYDTQYGIFIKPDGDDSWTIIQAANASTISTGKLTLSRAVDSPSGNVPKDGTNVTIAKFDLKATGEDIKITQMAVRVYGTVGTSDLDQGAIYFDGNQKGATTDLNTDSTDSSTAETLFNFGNTFIVPADGQTHTLEIRAHIKKGDSSSFAGGETFTVKIHSVTAYGRESLQSVSVGTALGHQLTIATGQLSAAKNNALSDWSSSNPTGVRGATEVLVGSFVITAGSAEGAYITAIKVTDSSNAFANLQNLKVYQGTKETGTQIGYTQSSLTAGSTYTFYPSPYISLEASEQFVLNVYADILTGASTGAQGAIVLAEVNGVGKLTNTSVNFTTNITGQSIYIAQAGSLTISTDSGTPDSAQVIAGTAGVEFTKIRFTAGAGEDIKVKQIVLTATLGSSAPTSSIANISLWDEQGNQIGSTVASLSAGGKATFNLSTNPLVIPAADYKVITVKADINHYSQIVSGGSVALGIASASDVTAEGAVSGSSSVTGSASGNAMYTYKTVLTFALNASSPSGSSFPSANQHVLYLDVTNEGSYDGYLNAVTFKINYIQGTGNATTAAERIFSLYKSTDLTTPLATTSIAAGTTINGATFTFNNINYIIPGGQTKTLYLIGDTLDCGVTSGGNAGSRIQFYINSGSDVNWDDAVASAVQSNLTKTFPLYGNTLTY